jgi:CubicO group peptidase (beta-lactamase class C family)
MGSEQIVLQKWVEDSTIPHAPGYGYQWWLRDVNGVFVFSAVGQGGNHIFCIPLHELVVAVVSKLGSRWRDRWLLIEELVKNT